MKSKINGIIKELIEKGEISNNRVWQSKEIVKDFNPIIELHNVYLKLGSTKNIAKETDADLPWAEEHFKERISGIPSNPGKAYKKWKYYNPKSMDNDLLFREKGIFSHTYQERFWSRNIQGLRFRHGDLNDLIYKLKLNPYTRQAYFPIYWAEDVSVIDERIPCTLGYWFYYKNGKMNMTYHIRSCDAARHFRNDVYLAYRLLEHVSGKINMEPGELDMWIGSFHCFQSDLYTLKKRII